jgi:hypothetical protein
MDALNWRKASYSASNGGCVEVAGHSDLVIVRDTRDRPGPVLRFSPAAWRVFAERVKRFLAPDPVQIGRYPQGIPTSGGAAVACSGQDISLRYPAVSDSALAGPRGAGYRRAADGFRGGRGSRRYASRSRRADAPLGGRRQEGPRERSHVSLRPPSASHIFHEPSPFAHAFTVNDPPMACRSDICVFRRSCFP